MRKSTRTALFFSLLVLFLIIAPAIIAYSQGYRVDFENKKLVKTGGLFFEPRPAPVEFYINGKLEKKSNFVFQNIFIGDLLPRTYFIEIKKGGYFAWRKALVVEEKLVAEAKNLMLFPESPSQDEIYSDVKTFSPHSNFLSLIETGAFPSITLYKKGGGDALVLNNLISRDLKEIRWSKDITRAIFNTGKSWILISTDEAKKPADISNEIASNDAFSDYTVSLFAPKITDMKWNKNNNTLFFLARDARALKRKVNILFSYNLDGKKLSSPLAYNVGNYEVSDEKLIYVSSILGDVHSINLENQTSRPLSPQSITRDERDTVKLMVAGEEKIVALVDNGIKKLAYVYKKDKRVFEQIFIDYDIADAFVAEDKKKVMFMSKNSILAYWLEEIHIQPFREPGDTEEIFSSQNPILSAEWFAKDSAHIFFSTREGVWVTELDGRDKRNTHKLSDLPAQKLHYDTPANILYILSNNTLYSVSL